MATQPNPRLSENEYLARERKANERHEYLDGQMFAMAGATRYHGRIVSNLHYQLRQQLEPSCNVYTSDMRVNVSALGLYTYPDVVVTCGEETFLDEQVDTLVNPVLLIEVLSPSTQDYDRGSKFEYYRTITSLKEYITVAQDRVHILQCFLTDAGWVLRDHSDYSSTLKLKFTSATISLAAIYEKVKLVGAV